MHSQPIGRQSHVFVIAMIVAAAGSTVTAFVASFLGYLDAHVVALIALISATGACFAAISCFLYFVVSDRKQMKL
jgi:hypothetical protein